VSAGVLAMLAGLFVVPIWLLWAGHHWRTKSPRTKGAFWGGVIGHTFASLLATIAAMYNPALWSDTDVVRGFLGFWLMLVLGAGGIVVGALYGERRGRE
jgi:hypothetical protein